MPNDWKQGLPIDKDRPSPEWIAALRRRFTVEPAVDRLLTRKLQRRAGPPYRPLTLEQLSEGVQALLAARIEGAFSLADARWLSGGASKLQMVSRCTGSSPASARRRGRWCCAWSRRNRSWKPAACASSS